MGLGIGLRGHRLTYQTDLLKSRDSGCQKVDTSYSPLFLRYGVVDWSQFEQAVQWQQQFSQQFNSIDCDNWDVFYRFEFSLYHRRFSY